MFNLTSYGPNKSHEHLLIKLLNINLLSIFKTFFYMLLNNLIQRNYKLLAKHSKKFQFLKIWIK